MVIVSSMSALIIGLYKSFNMTKTIIQTQISSELDGASNMLSSYLESQLGSLELNSGGELCDQNGKPIDGNYEAIDKFCSDMNVVATIFVKKDNDYIRVITTITDDSGERAVGTALDTTGKAYSEITKGNSYIGENEILGVQYMTKYIPMYNSDNQEIGLYFVGVPMSVVTEIHSMIDNMNNLALKDPLTQIYNRRYMEEKLPIDLVNSVLLSQPLSIIMADIDFFKKVNDTYGHLTGDCVLKSFTETISECIKRGSDWIARYGGEEFVVCLPGANLERAKELAEQMRKSIEEKSINCGENKIKITASFGVCSANVKTTQSESIKELIQRVDDKLYLPKLKCSVTAALEAVCAGSLYSANAGLPTTGTDLTLCT